MATDHANGPRPPEYITKYLKGIRFEETYFWEEGGYCHIIGIPRVWEKNCV